VTVVGELSLWIALFLSVWASAAAVAAAKLRRPELATSSSRAILAAAAMTALACAGLWTALLRHDFSLRYVASHTTLNTPTLYLLTAFWAGPEGRVAFLAGAVGIGAVVVVGWERRLEVSTRVAAVGVLATLLALLLLIVCFGINPYEGVEWVPAEGQGLDPQLQTPLAALFFLTTYAGYAAASVALALAVAVALVGGVDERWVHAMWRWCLACWCLLTVAIAARMRWSYVEPTSDRFPGLDRAQLTTIVVWILTLALVVGLRTRRTITSSALGRRLRLSGGVVLGLGVLLIVGGVASRQLWTDHSVSIRPGEATELTDRFGARWRFVSQGVSRDEQVNHLSTSVALEAWRDRQRVGFLSAERRQYLDSVQRPTFEPSVKPGIETTPRQDVYVVLSGLRSDSADLQIGFRPLVTAVWVGWLLVLLGGAVLAVAPWRGAAVQGSTSRAVPT
jgi:cytochrome c biogenesis factor